MRKVFEFLEDKKYWNLSPAARLLYVYMLAKVEEQINDTLIVNENFGWITFRRDDMSKIIGVSVPTIGRAKRELIKNRLITDIRIGACLPNLIYVYGITNKKPKRIIEEIKTSVKFG